jgi:hypothetical protein
VRTQLGGATEPADARRRGSDEVERATAAGWWAWRWYGWAPWPLDPVVLVLAAVTVAVDVGTAWADLSLGHLGRIPISPALPIALLLVARVSAGALGCSRSGVRAWRELGIVLALLVGTGVLTYSTDVGGAREAGGLVVAAAGEELVYRLALLLLVGAVFARCSRGPWRDPTRWGSAAGTVALLAGALVFSALPGHVSQMHGVTSTAPFASLAIVLGWVVLRTGALWPAIGAHAVLNLATITALAVAAPPAIRLGLTGATLLALVVAADVAGRRTGRLRPVPSTIDLTVASPGAPVPSAMGEERSALTF